ncbi:MAG: SDR family NAD(P)-dependent oxidoreductase, partial [Bryobacteraceae bacterium]
MRIDGKAALITGGASGLGAASTRMIVAAGGNVVIVDLNEPAGTALAAELGDRAAFLRADVSDPDQMEAAVQVCIKRFGGIHVLISCAGAG